MATVEIKGLQGLITKLRALGRDIDTVVDNSLHKSAYDIRKDTVNNIDAAGAVRTGRLRKSITVEKLGKCRYAVGTGVEYAPDVEFGTGSKGDPTVPHTSKIKWVYCDREGKFHTAYPQPARPYLRPAFEARKQAVKDALVNDILKAAGGGGSS